jgi:hypothetical protein
MTIGTIDDSQRKAASVAGLSYLVALVALVLATFGFHGGLVVEGNAAQTAANITSHEVLFRVGVAFDVIHVTAVLVLLTSLYVILKRVSPGLALLATVFRFMYALAWVPVILNQFDALRFLSGSDYVQGVEAGRLQTLASFALARNQDTFYFGFLFLAFASTVCSYLWLQAKYIPRALAVFGVIGSVWCVFSTFAFLIFPNFANVVNPWLFDPPMDLFELALSIWLLVKGLSLNTQLSPTTPKSLRVET